MKSSVCGLLLVLAVAACASGPAGPSRSTSGTPTVAGQYQLQKIDGLSCCAQDTPGYSLLASLLQIGWNTAPKTYVWSVTLQDTLSNGVVTSGDIIVHSAGTYTLDGRTLTLTDTITGGGLTGTWNGGSLLTLQGNDHTYEFGKLPQLPHP